jgi:hypothetical protein
MTKSPTFKDFRAAYEAGRLLDLEINGRALRTFTADDCYAFGGWLKDVGWRVRHGWSFRHGNDQVDDTGSMTVGDTYNETTLGWSFLVSHALDLNWAKADPSENVQPGDEFDGTQWEPEVPHFGRHASHFARYAEQIGKAISRGSDKIRGRKLR